jgi:hypothetical protein
LQLEKFEDALKTSVGMTVSEVRTAGDKDTLGIKLCGVENIM